MVWRLSGNENMWIILTPSITGFSEAYSGWEPHGSSMLTLKQVGILRTIVLISIMDDA